MQHFSDNVTDAKGNAIAGVLVLVQINGVNAAIYSDNGVTRKANPTTTDANGAFSFYAASGTYTLQMTSRGTVIVPTSSPITLFDPADGFGAGVATSLATGAVRTTGYSTGSQSINFASVASSYSTQWVYGRLYGFGTIAAGGLVDSFNSIVAIDQANAQAVPFLSGFNVTYRAAVGAVGGRIAAHSDMGVTGAVTAGTGTPDFVSNGSHAFASANAGGNGVFVTTPDDGFVGGLFGGNDHPRLASGGTFWRFLAGREIDVEIEAGGSAYARVGLFIVTGTNAASQASGDDAAIGFSNKSGTTVPWKHGIKFGMTWGTWPFDSSSTLIGAQKRVYPTSNPESVVNANYGVDLSTVTFATAAFKSLGFLVDPDGDTTVKSITLTTSSTPASAVATGAAGQIAWDSSYLYIATGVNQWRRVAHATW